MGRKVYVGNLTEECDRRRLGKTLDEVHLE
jgi:hypothetical protein